MRASEMLYHDKWFPKKKRKKNWHVFLMFFIMSFLIGFSAKGRVSCGAGIT